MKKITITTVLIFAALLVAGHVSAKESCLIEATVSENQTGELVLSGTAYQYHDMCEKWVIMQKTVGTVSIYDSKQVKVLGPITLDGPDSSGYPEFNYSYPISFTQIIGLPAGFTGLGKLVISDYSEDDPDEGEEVSTKTIPIVFGGGTFSGFTKKLTYGMKGNREVFEMQKVLAKLGIFKGEIAGDFGAKTRTALKEYQKKHNLEQTGYTGPKTRAYLNEDL